jgi:hypothetical protein
LNHRDGIELHEGDAATFLLKVALKQIDDLHHGIPIAAQDVSQAIL